ncbi:hypothetical protein [uncultured Zhongshania sp.]|uniref:hypothetical protein n=1 Tax=uncultured Zhongshania sp. TaxID=1642288 RepID=UPI0030DA37F8|tara:strand:+ start:378 stop:683 length:306 start_codon:yes stop_codon:yes gene_type:complete
MPDRHQTLLTPQSLFMMGSLVFSVGVSYATLSTADTAQEESIKVLQERQGEFGRDVQDIKVKVGKIEAGQDAQSKEIGLMRDDVKEVRAYMQQILRELKTD